MKTANYTDFKSNIKGYIDTVIAGAEPVIINHGGGRGVVLISLEEYNSLIETEYIMSSPEMAARIKDAEKNIRDGKGKKIETEDLWK